MSLHYLVSLEMFITQVRTVHCQRNKQQNLSHVSYGLQISRIWKQLITACGNTARKNVQNMHNWSGWTETATENGVDRAASCRHCVSGVVDSCRSLLHVFYTLDRSLKPKGAIIMGFRSDTRCTTFLFHFHGHKYIRITGEKLSISKGAVFEKMGLTVDEFRPKMDILQFWPIFVTSYLPN